MVGHQTGILEKENDPSILQATSPGKLNKFLVGDGEHVSRDQEYCIIEVRKMFMSLCAKESGLLHYVKRPGAILKTASTIATLRSSLKPSAPWWSSLRPSAPAVTCPRLLYTCSCVQGLPAPVITLVIIVKTSGRWWSSLRPLAPW